MTIQYADIISKCRELSSFEGRRIQDAEGVSLYPDIYLTEQDESLIRSLADDAATTMHSALRYAIVDTGRTSGAITLTPTTNTSLSMASDADKIGLETVSMYVMWQWLKDKSAERSDAYKLMFDNMLASLVRIGHCKKAPNLEDY